MLLNSSPTPPHPRPPTQYGPQLYHAFPFSGFLVFLAVYSGIAQNQNLSRFARFSATQAVLLDILLM